MQIIDGKLVASGVLEEVKGETLTAQGSQDYAELCVRSWWG